MFNQFDAYQLQKYHQHANHHHLCQQKQPAAIFMQQKDQEQQLQQRQLQQPIYVANNNKSHNEPNVLINVFENVSTFRTIQRQRL